MASTHVPVEHRIGGLDRRTIRPAVIIALIVAAYAIVIPFIDEQLDHDRAVEAGEVLVVGSGVGVVAPVGWEVTEQTALTEGVLEIHNSGLTVQVTVGPYVEDELQPLVDFANELVESDAIRGPQRNVTATGGAVGVQETFDGTASHGRVAVFAQDGVGVQIVAEGPAPMDTRFDDELDDLIRSVRFGVTS